MTGTTRTLRALRSFLLALAAWVLFFGLQAVMSAAFSPPAVGGLRSVIETDLTLAVMWGVFSVGIIWWHDYVRTLAPNLYALVLFHLPTLALATLIDSEVSRVVWVALTPNVEAMPFLAWLIYYADLDIVCYIAVVAVAETLLVRRTLLERQRVARTLEASLNRARLDHLEAQLQPHFLFNSLGAVSELAFDAPATAGRVLRHLSAIFRATLARKVDEVTLGEEIVGIEPYLDIQRIRFADWLTIDYRVDDEAVDCLLPRFILQPLVENAIRHGLSGRDAAGTIEISAVVDSRSLIVRVTDNGVGLNAAPPSSGSGIGLANVRDRLAILYGDDDRLTLTNSSSGGATAELRVPARHRTAATPDPAAQSGGAAPLYPATLRALRMPRLFQRRWVAIPVIWLICGLAWTQQSFLYMSLRHRLAETGWPELARTNLISAAIWIVLTPVVLALTNRFPVRRGRLILAGIGYLLAAFATLLAHTAALAHLTAPGTALLSPTWRLDMVIGFVIFLTLAAIGHRGVLADWLRARESADAALTTELAAAQDRASKLQRIPRVLLHSLDGIADTVRRDPSLTERQLTRLADYLRLALDATDAHGVTPERERAMDDAVAALRETGAFLTDLSLTA